MACGHKDTDTGQIKGWSEWCGFEWLCTFLKAHAPKGENRPKCSHIKRNKLCKVVLWLP